MLASSEFATDMMLTPQELERLRAVQRRLERLRRPGRTREADFSWRYNRYRLAGTA
jgi:hypothetical protein